MTALAWIIHPTVGRLDFLVGPTSDGFPMDQAEAIEEELIGAGVDGVRYRTDSYQQAEFDLTSTADFTAFALGVAERRRYKKAKDGRPVQLFSTIAGSTWRWKRVHIKTCAPKLFPGGVYGPGQDALSAFHIQCVWTLRIMDATTVGEQA